MLYGSEACPMKKANKITFQQTDENDYMDV